MWILLSAAYELKGIDVSVESSQDGGSHAILVRGVQVFPRGLLQEVRVSINRCLVVPGHLAEEQGSFEQVFLSLPLPSQLIGCTD